MTREHTYHNVRWETAGTDELRAAQLEHLRAQLQRIHRSNAWFRGRLDQVGFAPGDLRNIDDLRHLPLMSKEDFRKNYPLAKCCVDKAQIRDWLHECGRRPDGRSDY